MARTAIASEPNAQDAAGIAAGKTAPQSILRGLSRKMMAGLVALSVGAMGLPAMSVSAQADGYYGGYGYYDDYGYGPGYGYYDGPPRHFRHGGHRAHRAHHGKRHHHRHHRDDDDDEAVAAVAGAVIGLAIGAIIASEANRHNHRANRYQSRAIPPQARYQPQQRWSAPGPQAAHQWTVAPEPFTDEWYRYCADKYRSFDAETGTFQPYEGPRKLCR